jgi:hypothetical protein
MFSLTFGHDGIVQVPVKRESARLPYRRVVRRSPNVSLYKIDHFASCVSVSWKALNRLETRCMAECDKYRRGETTPVVRYLAVTATNRGDQKERAPTMGLGALSGLRNSSKAQLRLVRLPAAKLSA